MSLEEVAANQEAQKKISKTMDFLCPPGRSIGESEFDNLDWLSDWLPSIEVRQDGLVVQVFDGRS